MAELNLSLAAFSGSICWTAFKKPQTASGFISHLDEVPPVLAAILLNSPFHKLSDNRRQWRGYRNPQAGRFEECEIKGRPHATDNPLLCNRFYRATGFENVLENKVYPMIVRLFSTPCGVCAHSGRECFKFRKGLHPVFLSCYRISKISYELSLTSRSLPNRRRAFLKVWRGMPRTGVFKATCQSKPRRRSVFRTLP